MPDYAVSSTEIFHRTLRLPVLVASAVLLSGCGAFGWVPGIGKEAERPEPVVINNTPSDFDSKQFPVRQPPPPPRDGFAPSTSSASYNNGTSSIPLRANAPERYTVVRGDTLWDISGKFLSDPWYWPEIWQANPQVANPHLIYPGDVLRLVWIDGQPRIVMDRGLSGDARLSPQVRVQSLDSAISTIPYDVIEGFLSRPTVLTKKQARELPYIVDIKESHLMAGSGFTVYVRGADFGAESRYNVFSIGDVYKDPETGRKLGYEALYVGAGRITEPGDPARMFLTATDREALRGDRLIAETTPPPQNYFPSPPNVMVEGSIMSVIAGVHLIGQYQIVVVNRGSEDGLVQGNVLSVWQKGDKIRDRWADKGFFSFGGLRVEKVQLPDESAGEIMLFDVKEQISYGLVMRAQSEMKVGDRIRNPR